VRHYVEVCQFNDRIVKASPAVPSRLRLLDYAFYFGSAIWLVHVDEPMMVRLSARATMEATFFACLLASKRDALEPFELADSLFVGRAPNGARSERRRSAPLI
jgi:hypothetical protein